MNDLVNILTDTTAPMMERVATLASLAREVVPHGGSFTMEVRWYSFEEAPTTVVTLNGVWGADLAKANLAKAELDLLRNQNLAKVAQKEWQAR